MSTRPRQVDSRRRRSRRRYPCTCIVCTWYLCTSHFPESHSLHSLLDVGLSVGWLSSTTRWEICWLPRRIFRLYLLTSSTSSSPHHHDEHQWTQGGSWRNRVKTNGNKYCTSLSISLSSTSIISFPYCQAHEYILGMIIIPTFVSFGLNTYKSNQLWNNFLSALNTQHFLCLYK